MKKKWRYQSNSSNSSYDSMKEDHVHLRKLQKIVENYISHFLNRRLLFTAV